MFRADGGPVDRRGRPPRERLAETDRARERFVRDIYGLDRPIPGSTRCLDGTAFTTAACVEVIVAAVAAPRRHIMPVA